MAKVTAFCTAKDRDKILNWEKVLLVATCGVTESAEEFFRGFSFPQSIRMQDLFVLRYATILAT